MSAEIDVLIFSKDRPAQLALLLESMERFASFLVPSVIWKASNTDQHEAYNRLLNNPRLGITWPEGDFERDVREWIDMGEDTFGFLVDDDVFWRQALVPLALPSTYRLGDYDYPWALDGCIYRKDQILPRLAHHFKNPTQLEAGMAEWTTGLSLFQTTWPCLVGIPRVFPATRGCRRAPLRRSRPGRFPPRGWSPRGCSDPRRGTPSTG